MKSPLLSDITAYLAPISDTPALDASVLIAHVLNKPRSWVMAHNELTLTTEQQKQLDNSLIRLKSGEPFPYILGHWEFFGLQFDITPDTLIPRPETELLVERAIAWLQVHPAKRSVADVGTGSGAIAVSIAVNIPDAKILATDISSGALQVAKRNAEKFGVSERIKFAECDLLPHPFPPLPLGEGLGVRAFDLICANLPYIPTKTLHDLPIYSREPALALDGGEDGLDPFRKLLKLSPPWLAPDGMMLLEIESTLGSQALPLADTAFPEARISLHKDLAGKDRLLQIELQGGLKHY
ncbi:MAG: peptide chain release factor N(5)-glutamine methyltransferase [Chloroflexota bacterium]|nr:peptide chain release factor N(5)-glutamine methyltransferase [Chloroflexota bacterium]